MNTQAKKRLTLVGLIVVVVALVLFVVLGSGGTAKALSVEQAASGEYEGQEGAGPRARSWTARTRTQGTSAVFAVADEDNAAARST